MPDEDVDHYSCSLGISSRATLLKREIHVDARVTSNKADSLLPKFELGGIDLESEEKLITYVSRKFPNTQL